MNKIDFLSTIDATWLRGVALRCAAFGVLAAAITQSALAADASNGERLATRWCAACHVVASDQREANADAPPFAEIAKRPNFSESGLVTFLLDPHAKMPNMNLSRNEAADSPQAKVGALIEAQSVKNSLRRFESLNLIGSTWR